MEVVYLPGDDGTVDLVGLMDNLSQREVNELLVEAGPTLSGAMVQAGLVDEILLYLAPRILGNEARGMFDLPGIRHLGECAELDVTDIRQFGADIRIRLSPG